MKYLMHENKQHMNIGRGEREAFASLRSRTLSVEEKNAMRQVLQAAVIRSRADAVQPERSVLGAFAFLFGRPFAMSALAIVLIIGSSWGVARAAEQALPGEVLYPVKTKVNEPLVGSFKRSDAARAEWEHERVARRLAEAETLAEEGRLGEEEKGEIEYQLSLHRKTLEEIEGRDIDDDEFVPQQAGDKAKKTRVHIERQENEVRVHIEERESEDESDENEEARSSAEDRTDGSISRKGRDGENKSSSEAEADRQKTSDQKRGGDSGEKDSSSKQKSSSGSQESGQDDTRQDGEDNDSNNDEN